MTAWKPYRKAHPSVKLRFFRLERISKSLYPSKMMISFDPDKYLQLQKTQGTSAALTELQKDLQIWEYEAFEGPKGYQPQMWEEIDTARAFSRKLWTEASNAFKPESSLL